MQLWYKTHVHVCRYIVLCMYIHSMGSTNMHMYFTFVAQSVYLEALLHPGRFATAAINRALEVH